MEPPTDRPKLSVITGDKTEEVDLNKKQAESLGFSEDPVQEVANIFNKMMSNYNTRYAMLKLAIDFSKYDHQMDTPEDQIIRIADKFFNYVMTGVTSEGATGQNE